MVFKNIEKSTSLVLTKKEIEVINKKLRNEKLTQQDSNYLSRYIRPKLREISSIDAKLLLNKMEYNQKAMSIEKRIKKIILSEIKNIRSIIIYGSAVQNNYTDYNDVDVLAIVNKKFWKKLREKYKKILEIKHLLKKHLINVDLGIYDGKTFESAYPSNISLIYQLRDRKVIYGKLSLPSKIEIPKLELRMKADYSIIEEDVSGLEIYKAIRNLILIILALRKIVDNRRLIESVNEEIGKNLSYKLKTNKESAMEKKIALLHLNRLLIYVLKNLKAAKWEKIVLSSH